MINDVYRHNPVNNLWNKNLGVTFKFDVQLLKDTGNNFHTFEICPYLYKNLATHYEMGPEREAFFAANIGLEFEGFCDYSSAIYDIDMKLLYYTNFEEERLFMNETFTYDSQGIYNETVDVFQFDELRNPDLLKGTLDGKGQFMIGYGSHNLNMPLGTYRVELTLNSFGDANWNYKFPMDVIELNLVICEDCDVAEAA